MKKKKKNHLFDWLIALLLAAGVGVMSYPTVSDWVIRHRLSQEISSYHEVVEGTEEDFSSLWEAAEAYNRTLLTKSPQLVVTPEEKEYVSTLLNPLGTGMMGSLDIPKIGIHLPVYQGTEEKELQTGAGYWLGSSLPTGGPGTHTILTAHTGLVRAKMFTDLDKLVAGDTFSIEVLDRVLTYEVDQIKITEPEELDELYIRPGEDLLTLYTCYPYGVNTQRLLVRGHRIPTPEPETDSKEQMRQWLEEWWPWMTGGLITSLLLFWNWKKRRSRRKTEAPEAPAILPIAVDLLGGVKKEPGWIRRIPIRLRTRLLPARVMKQSDWIREAADQAEQRKAALPPRKRRQTGIHPARRRNKNQNRPSVADRVRQSGLATARKQALKRKDPAERGEEHGQIH